VNLGQVLQDSWNKANWLTVVLWPLSLVYIVLFNFKRFIYRAGIIDPYRAAVPVIVVGNITVGGTGKTPLVIHLIEVLRKLGYKPGVISRGYGGRAVVYPVLVDGETPASIAGDEPALIVRRTAVPMSIGPRRGANIEMLLENSDVDIVISDDGLQHFAMESEIEICIVDDTNSMQNTNLLPAGPFREPRSRLKSVDLVVHHVAKINEDEGQQLQMCLQAVELQKIGSENASNELEFDPIQTVHAVAAIGNPNRFFDTCRKLGWQIEEHAFADHHLFTANDLEFPGDGAIVMTEKDAVKCLQFDNDRLWYLPVDVRISSQFESLLTDLLSAPK